MIPVTIPGSLLSSCCFVLKDGMGECHRVNNSDKDQSVDL